MCVDTTVRVCQNYGFDVEEEIDRIVKESEKERGENGTF